MHSCQWYINNPTTNNHVHLSIDKSYTRKFARLKSPPYNLKDYNCNIVTSHWYNLIAFDSIKPSSFLNLQLQHDEPKTYKQASKDPTWVEVIAQELRALENTWDIVDLPPDKKIIAYK